MILVRRPALARRVLHALAVVAVLVVGACANSTSPDRPSTSRSMNGTSRAPSSSRAVPSGPGSSSRTPLPGPPAVRTPEGMWWGVDSTTPMSEASLANVRDWYGGARPQFWGRYLGGRFAVDRAELAFARAHHVYVYLIVPDDNCSGCGGGDACGQDTTAEQAASDAQDAVTEARRLALPAGTVLFKDIEQVSSCRGEPSPTFLLTWQRTLAGSGYRTGLYGNVHRQYYDFPRAYCAAVAQSTAFRDEVLLDMNEDEPLIGAARGSTSPHTAPRFAPKSPDCAPAAATVIWQYGETRDDANLTDIDQARPDTPGMLAPDGGVT